MSKPLAIELFAGMFGWGRGLIAEGFRVFGFDIVHEPYHGEVPEDCHLVLQDVLTLHGKQFKNATLIVASPPCQAYSYRAMPWSRAKALPPPDNALFDSCFRIQREASAAAGRYIPLIVENVRGAQKWVGRAKWHYGSFYLWGDVPALMPINLLRNMKSNFGTHERMEGPGRPRFIAEGDASIKCRGGMSPGQQWMRGEIIGEGIKFPGNNSPRRWEDREIQRLRDVPLDGVKQGGDWFDTSDPNSISRTTGSKSPRRKAAAAQIAQIPFPLAQHIARVFKPVSA